MVVRKNTQYQALSAFYGEIRSYEIGTFALDTKFHIFRSPLYNRMSCIRAQKYSIGQNSITLYHNIFIFSSEKTNNYNIILIYSVDKLKYDVEGVFYTILDVVKSLLYVLAGDIIFF